MIHLQIMHIENVAVVEVSGRMETLDAMTLQEALSYEIDNGNSNLVVDLSSVDFIDSAGLRTLVLVYKRVKRMAGDLRLAQPSYPVREILRVTGLQSIFRTFATLAAAVESY